MMHLYHGSPHLVEALKPPTLTGRFRPGEEGREEFADVIFFTSDRDLALTYAGPDGYLYVADVANPRNYADEVASCREKRKKLTRKRLASLRRDVFVAHEADVSLKARFFRKTMEEV